MFNRLRALMAGRNGFDQVAITMFGISLVLNFAARFTGWIPMLSITLLIISAALVALALMRVFSKNVAKRREENYRFVRISGDLRNEFNAWRVRRSESKQYKFYSCPDCKSRLRVQRGKGKIQITCPRCGLRFIKKS